MMTPKNISPAKQGQSQQTRGTTNTLTPTQPLRANGATTPLGGQPMSINKNPMVKVNDNVTNATNRKVQSNFNTGPNGTTNMTGQQNTFNPFNKGNPYGNPYSSNVSFQSPYNLQTEKGQVDKMPPLLKVFGEYKKSKPLEVAEEDEYEPPKNYDNSDEE